MKHAGYVVGFITNLGLNQKYFKVILYLAIE